MGREKAYKSLTGGSGALLCEGFAAALMVPLSLLQALCLSGSRRREGLSLGGVRANSCKIFLGLNVVLCPGSSKLPRAFGDLTRIPNDLGLV